MKNNSKKGFTIIELLAAVVIVGIIISLAVIVIDKYILQGRNAVDNQIEKQLILAAKSYYSNNKTKFITSDDNVVVWYTTLKAENYMSNDLVDSNGNSCAKSYVVVSKDKTKYSYSGCVLCDNNGYNNTKDKKECTESLNNHIYCEWRDINNKKIDSNDITYLGVKKNNEVSLKLYCKGNGINFRNPKNGTYLNNVKKLINDMFVSSKGTVSIPNKDFDHNNNNAGIRDFTSIVTFKASSINTFEKGSITFKTGASYVKNKNTKINEDIYNEKITYDGILIDGKGPSCSLTGPYKDSGLKTNVKSVKNGSTVYYGLKCNDDSNISNVDANTIKNGFESSTAISNLAVSKFVKGSNQKSFDAVVGITVTNPNINANTKVFNLNLAFKANVVKDIFDNGNERITSKIDGKNTALSIDDQGPVCTFNGPAENALFKISKRTLNIVDDHPNDYVYYELRCTDENGINPSTFRFSDIKNNGFSKIEQSGDMNKVENNGVLIGYTYYIKAYENPNVVPNTTKATLKYNESNLSDTTGNKGQRTIESNPVIMVDNNAIPSCNITYSSNNDGTGRLTGVMNDNIGLTGYAWSTSVNEPNPSDYTSISGTSRTVYDNVYKTGTYYLHMINELGLPGYCQIEGGRIVINQPKNPKIDASDRIVSGNWHNQDYTLTAKDSSSGVTYYIGTNASDLNVGTTQSVNYETKGTTYYAKTCWNKNKDVCSDTVQYSAKLDKTPPTCTVSMTKYGQACPEDVRGEIYEYNNWTQCGVEVILSNCSDSISGMSPSSPDSHLINYYTEKEHTVVFSNMKDNAGNYYTSGKKKIKIDRTLPKIVWSVKNGAALLVGDTVTAECTDEASGVSGFGGIFINNSETGHGTDIIPGVSKQITFKTTGSKKLYANCTDKAGNPSFENKTWSNAEITVDVKKKVYSFSRANYGSGTCPYGNCCSSSPDECNENTHGKMQYKDCEAETKTSYDWKYVKDGSSPKAYSGKAGKWCKNNGFDAKFAGCDGSGNYCTSSTVNKTCRKSSGGEGAIVNCTIYKCTRSVENTGNYTYGESRKCVYNLSY